MRRKVLGVRQIATVLLTLSASLSLVTVAAAASRPYCHQSSMADGWSGSGVTFNRSAQIGSSLDGVISFNGQDAWAVGYRESPNEEESLIEHYNGKTWSIVSSPNPGGRYGTLLASVDGVTADDVWAVGSYGSRCTGDHTLILHWNGKVWKRVASPDPGDTQLLSVSAVSREDLWAAGYGDPSGSGIPQAFTFHWNGSAWSLVNTPNPKGSQRVLFGVSATGTTAAWAVGATVPRKAPTVAKTLAEHWNGHAWHQVGTASPGHFLNELFAVSVVAPGDAWAVGDFANTPKSAFFPLVEHFAAGHWIRATIPRLGPGSALLGVSGDAPGDVWAVGTAEGSHAVMLHWDGRRWHRYAGPGSDHTAMSAVTTRGSVATFAVGTRLVHGRWHRVQEQWNGHAWIR